VSVDAVEFHDVQRVFGLFADGLAGQPMHLEPAAEDDASGWPWDADRLPDPETVRVPAAIAAFGSGRANRRAYRAAVLHQAGYVEFGTFDLDPQLRDAAFATTRHPGLLRRLFTILEDVRVDAATRRAYPGARGDLDALRPEVLVEQPVVQGDALVEALRWYSIGAQREDLLVAVGPVRANLLAHILDLAEPLRSPSAGALDSARLAVAIGELVDEELPFDPDAPFAVIEAPEDAGALRPPGEQPRGGDVPRPPSADMEQSDELDRLGGQIIEMLMPDPGVPEPDTERPAGRRSTDLVYPPDDERDTRVFVYDEWSYLERRYLPAWCRVLEKRLHGDDTAFIGEVRRRHAVLASRVRRQFSFVRPEGWLRVHHADDGDELDLDAVIEAVVDRRTGHVPDDRLHIRRERAARDVATAFLVDLSASTSSPVVDEDAAPDPTEQEVMEYRFGGIDPFDMPPPLPTRRVLDVAKESVALMCDALDVLGDRHAVYGFSGEGRHHVDFHVAKDFDDRTTPATWASIAAMRSLRYTRMGPAVRHATAKLVAEPERTKLLIVISDGYPQDTDYGPQRGDTEYGLEDTARALQDAVDTGIHPYCVTIDPAGYDYLRRMCPDQSYVVIDDVPALPRELAKLYGALATHRE
jgi:nitric oxide reductase NorD protein